MSKKGKDLSADEKYIYHLHSKITALEVALKDTQEDKILYRTWLSEALKIDPESDQKSKDAFLERIKNFRTMFYNAVEENTQLLKKVEELTQRKNIKITEICDDDD